jgi:hypothetical protein
VIISSGLHGPTFDLIATFPASITIDPGATLTVSAGVGGVDVLGTVTNEGTIVGSTMDGVLLAAGGLVINGGTASALLVHLVGIGDSVGPLRRTESHLPQFAQKTGYRRRRL